MVEKLKRKIDNFSFDKLKIFDRFDGANHLETVEVTEDLVSFSSTMINKELLTFHDYSNTQSRNILTWTQVAAKE